MKMPVWILQYFSVNNYLGDAASNYLNLMLKRLFKVIFSIRSINAWDQ